MFWVLSWKGLVIEWCLILGGLGPRKSVRRVLGHTYYLFIFLEGGVVYIWRFGFWLC